MKPKEKFVEKASNYVQSLIDASGKVKMNRKSKHSFIATCFMANTLYGLNKNDSRLEEIGQTILKNRCNDNSYWDNDYPLIGTSNFNSEYLRLQFTSHALSALTCCNVSHDKKVDLEKYLNLQNLKIWLVNLNWSNPWLEGNRVMFLCIVLYHNSYYCKDKDAEAALNFILDWLDDFQDKTTGYWGTDKGATLSVSMAGAFHEFIIYDYLNREIKCRDKVIDSTLSLQNPFDFLFSPHVGGGACHDIDAIDILANSYRRSNHRKNDIIEAMRKSKVSILQQQNLDGGFPFTKESKFQMHLLRHIGGAFIKKMPFVARLNRIKSIPNVIIKKALPISFSAHPLIVTQPHQSDIFSTWFRLNTIALIDACVDSKWNVNKWWNFSHFIGIGWHNDNI